jgi:hypothetical protein
MCPAQVYSVKLFLWSAYEAKAEAFSYEYMYLALHYLLPMMYWAKHPFASLRKNYPDPTIHAVDCLTNNCWYSVQNTNLWWITLMLWSCGWSAASIWWVVACSWLALLLLVQLLVACPSPPGWLLVLHLLELLRFAWPSPPGMVLSFRLLHGFAGCDSNGVVVLWKNWWCSCDGPVLVLYCSVVSFLLWPSLSSPAAGSAELLWCCQQLLLSSVTELLVCCLPKCWSDPSHGCALN